MPAIHGWLDDMSSSRKFAERLIQEAESDSPETVLLDALSAAAIVRYFRCFTTGRRERLRIEQLPSATEAETALHERICGMRNWHISHPVNQQEAHAVYVIVDESPGATTGALGISSQATAQIPLEPLEAREMADLCSRWIAWLEEQLAQESTRLMPLASPLSREELLALPRDEPQYNEDVHAKRKR
jgi:hypothetical protein